MGLPLYRFRGNVLPPPSTTAHPGLVFDKWVTGWSEDWKQIPPGKKEEHHKNVARRDMRCLASGLEKALARRKELVAALGGEVRRWVTDWRLVSGLGTGHPFETGFIWHRTLGVPYLPGSAVKGGIRAWATEWEGEPQDGVIRRLFGLRGPEAEKTPETGSMMIFDALPVSPPKLEVDIMNPHYGPYYMDPEGKKPPADYYSPVPIFFLTVAPDQLFEFAVAPRPGAYRKEDEDQRKSDLGKAMTLLGEALTTIGIGGKTAVGYGYFKEAGA